MSRKNVLVEAAAGTGKTTWLIAQIIEMIVRGDARVPHMAVLTFTEKAAGELKLRLRSELERARATASSADIGRIEQALLELEEARVSTIHTFCSDLLRERPVEARVDPAFRMLAEPESVRLLRLSFDLWLQRSLSDLPEGLRRFLRRIPRGNREPVDALQRAAIELAQWRDFTAPWSRDAFDRDQEIADLTRELHAFADQLRDCDNKKNDYFFRDTNPALRVSDELLRREEIGESDADYTEARLIDLLFGKFMQPRGRKAGRFGPNTMCSDVRDAHDKLLFKLRSFEARANADLAALLHDELRGAIELYEEHKRRLGALDFTDLLLRVRDLLRDDAEVLQHFQNEIRHVFVDEFQDTDPIQVEILLLLSNQLEPGRLFLVGDPKQSIYRFRRADLGMYADLKQRLRESDAEIRELTTSYRSTPEIQNFVNAAFAKAMTGDRKLQQADYEPLRPHRKNLERPSIVALPVPRPYGQRDITDEAIEESLPDAVASYIEWLLTKSGWGIEPRDICILFRRFEKFGADVTRKYVQCLEARGIAQLLVGGKAFHAREEIETLRTGLTAIEWPDDELSMYATLRGSLFGITDEELFEYRNLHHRLNPFAIPEELPERLAPIGTALKFMASLHATRNYRPVADTLRRLFSETRCHAGFVLRPSGKQALANVMQMLEQARVYDESGALSFRGFVEQLLDEAEHGRSSEAPVLEEGSDGVRLMTVHKAKGLEFPVVILADITCNETRGSSSRYVDAEKNLAAMELCGLRPVDVIRHEAEEIVREESEAVRLAYVAATRARDLLVVPAVADRPLEGKWMSVLNRALYPFSDSRQQAADSRRVKRSGFGEDATVRPFELLDRGANTVKPGDYRFENYSVTWWDSRALNLDVPLALGIPQQELLGKDAPEGLIENDLRTYREWQRDREAAVAKASRESVRVLTAIERSMSGDVPDVDIVVASRSGVHGQRYGTLVHSVMSLVSLTASRKSIESVTNMQARILGAPNPEIAACVTAVSQLLTHELLIRASKAVSLRREVPVTLTEGESIVEGVVDLAFEDADGWTVLDFKTDAELETRADAYKRQVAIYASAIASATGRPAKAILVQV